MYQASTSASAPSCTNAAMQLRGHNQLCPGSSEHLQKKPSKILTHILAQVSTCLCASYHHFGIFKVKSSTRLQPHRLGDGSQPDPKSPQRNGSFSVDSVVLWIWLVTPVSPWSLVSSFHLQSLLSPVSQNCREQLKRVNYLKCCFCLKNQLWLIHWLQPKQRKHCLQQSRFKIDDLGGTISGWCKAPKVHFLQ